MLKQLDNTSLAPNENHAAELIKLSLPIIGMAISRMAMGLIDFVMVSSLGTEAQAAISPATTLVFALACIGMGASQSIQTFVSQADGRGEPHKAGGYAWQAFYIAAVFAAFTVPAVWGLDVWFAWIASKDFDPVVAKLETDYLRIALWCVPPAVACAGLQGFFNGVQKPSIALLATIVSLGVNAVGNYALIFGHFGFPAMGIAGAAIATVFAWIARMVFMAGAMLLPRFDQRYHTRRAMALSFERISAIARIGGPVGLQWLVDIGSWVVFMNVMMPPFGKSAMAASNIAMQYMHLSFMPAIGIGMALCSQVGHAIGRGRPDHARIKAWVAMRLTGVYMGAVGVGMLAGGALLIDLFSDDPQVIQTGRMIMVWVAIFQVFDAMTITYMNALRGAGDTRWPALMVGFCCWVIFIGGGCLAVKLAPQWGVNGPWLMCTVYVIVLGVALLMRWRGGSWQRIRLFDDARGGDAAAAGQPAAVESPVFADPPADVVPAE